MRFITLHSLQLYTEHTSIDYEDYTCEYKYVPTKDFNDELVPITSIQNAIPIEFNADDLIFKSKVMISCDDESCKGFHSTLDIYEIQKILNGD